jgi:hypothetical protein
VLSKTTKVEKAWKKLARRFHVVGLLAESFRIKGPTSTQLNSRGWSSAILGTILVLLQEGLLSHQSLLLVHGGLKDTL